MMTTAPWVAYPEILEEKTEQWVFRTPSLADGDGIHQLIVACPPLDVNSSYCNFLQSSHFKNTCMIATCDDEIAGFVSGYLKPECNDELFIWQVAIAPRYRGKGLALQMLKAILDRQSLQHVKILETTITQDNQGSWRLFEKLDLAHGNQGEVSTFLDEQQHFRGKHDTEYLYRIPLNRRSV
jgi:L-2,4-diaminobutyric acid acetyltransferase